MVTVQLPTHERPGINASGAKRQRHKTPAPDSRCRVMHKFWLDISKDAEFFLAEQVAMLKQQRDFTPTIRQGLELIVSLRQMRTHVLERLFPWIEGHYRRKVMAEVMAEVKAGQGEIAELRAELAAIRAEMQARPAMQPVARPADDDDLGAELVMRKAESDGAESAANFLKSMASLLQ